MAPKILAVDDNEINLKVVKATLTQGGNEVTTVTSGIEALDVIEELKPDLIILDISMPVMDGYEVCRRMKSNPQTSSIPIIMLTAYNALEDKIKGFEAGADDYLTKPFQPAELQARVSVLLRRSMQAPVSKPVFRQVNGKAISFFSMRGGSGVSTLATNVATGLAKLWNRPVALVDLSLAMGQSALLLNLSLRNTWVDLTQMHPEELEQDVLEAVMLKHDSGVHVLAAPRSIADAELIRADLVDRVIETLKGMYEYVILDLPSNFAETTLKGLDMSEQIVALLAPELASVRAMISTLEVFNELNYFDTKDLVITMNRTFDRRGLARKNIEKALKHPIQMFIPYAPDEFVSSINLGEPIVMGDSNQSIVGLFEDLAFLLSKDTDKEGKPINPSQMYMRVMDRIDKRQQKKKL